MQISLTGFRAFIGFMIIFLIIAFAVGFVMIAIFEAHLETAWRSVATIWLTVLISALISVVMPKKG